ncbi:MULTISPECIES: sn-glycerol-3-phosphate ABC transporter ATP-binding protein UgpC [unclassified Pseudomonas]|uniref:ABC transporter ATP-binding protein n=1 Tax=unclassified Pseudomonas TaxID=196821 RepID=UPI002AC995F9|nr:MULTISPECIES: sn-glycerol-3-phosphate ABC transporter ATP-binding protein UgpC [unclassified Pseudomonas]MEB0042563.1 sn-glycerol-3-phosphate ABC transporter ATP-binding protein UgpC [Pseudomonas sp. MH10]MEB0077307.1 sn-glycerol-3-phosphate ABC transporter ATP-binding protein UgpC [Pseudomonas sp. MH10out]MEB0091361.1 sn-glycerol-3-phosphate ABC transporter ATP-binding protein UgpC [Pseudomonas sp. CCI4.2]MEB0104104.1 sn-glycerol-3-phosphate ABC transporter ATP-binding protein UgpC [Pseudom
MTELKLRGVEKAYGDIKVLHDIELDIESREFVVFVGPSGCGKSTLLRSIAGLESITQGQIRIGSRDVTYLEPADRGVAMVFQSYALYPHMSVYDNIAFGLKMQKLPKAEIEAKVRNAARILQLDALLDRKPKALSGGQRQRVAIGRAIVHEPEVFLFDEPLSNLDASLRVQMRIEIAKLHAELQATMIYVTHDQVEAMTLADKIVVLNKGRIEQVGSPLELYHHPRNRFVAGFIGSPQMSFVSVQALAVSAEGVQISLPGGESLWVPVNAAGVAAGSTLTLGLRPEHVSERGQGEARILATALLVEHLGGETFTHAQTTDGHDVMVKGEGHSQVKTGQSLAIGVTGARCHLFDEQGHALAHLTHYTEVAQRQEAL